MRKRVRGLAGVKDALLCPGKSQIYVIARPIRAKTELAGGLGDTDPEALLSVGKLQRAELEHEGAVDVVHVLGALAVGEEWAEDHHGATVYEEAHLAPERAVQPLVDIGERLREHFAHKRNIVHVFQRRSDGCRRCMCYHPRFCWMPTWAHVRWTRWGTESLAMRVRVRIRGRCRGPFRFWARGGGG